MVDAAGFHADNFVDTPHDSLLTKLEELSAMLELLSPGLFRPSGEEEGDSPDGGNDDDDEMDDQEYEESYGTSKEDLREYVRKFREYARGIKKDADEIYGETVGKGDKQSGKYRDDTGIKSPAERGHKMGCGCPGCSAFREFFGIKIGKRMRPFDIETAAGIIQPTGKKETGKYDATNSRPCGGRMYKHFHGERADLKNVFGNYTGAFNFGRAGY